MSDLGDLSDWLRRDIIVASGGWLADIVPLISDALGIWDIFILSGVFILSWVMLRVTDSLTSMILGFTFDVTIPLQHYMNPNLKDEHKAHLEGYWPILTFGTGLEALCFFMIHPDLFTLVVCLKTTLMTTIWLARRADGSFLTESMGGRGARAKSASSSRSKRSSRPSSEAAAANEAKSDSKKEEEEQRKKKKAEEAKKAKERKPTPVDPKLESQKNPLKPTGQHPGNIDPSNFKGDLMDIYAPPGRGPPITNENLADDILDRKKRGLKEIEVRGSDSDSDRPVNPRKPVRGQTKKERQTFQRRGSDSALSAVQTSGEETDAKPGFFDRLRGNNQSKKLAKKLRGLGQTSPILQDPVKPVGRNAPGASKFQSAADFANNTTYIDEADECYQFPVETVEESRGRQVRRKMTRAEKARLEGTAVWEKALGHDSLDLLNHYMKSNGVYEQIAGYVIMDIVCEENPSIVQKMVNNLRQAYEKQDFKEFLKPYHYINEKSSGWRPARGFFGRGQIHRDYGGKVDAGEMDQFIWHMRRYGVEPGARHAMLRALMSQTKEKDYYGLKQHLMDAAEGKVATNWKPRTGVSKQEMDVAVLVKDYRRMNNFAGQYHISVDDMEKWQKRVMKMIPDQSASNMMRLARWGVERPEHVDMVPQIVATLGEKLKLPASVMPLKRL